VIKLCCMTGLPTALPFIKDGRTVCLAAGTPEELNKILHAALETFSEAPRSPACVTFGDNAKERRKTPGAVQALRVRSFWPLSTAMTVATGQCSCLARMFSEHDPAAAAGRGKRRQRGFCPHGHLTLSSGAAQLFDTVGVHGGTHPSGA
jgi:hypothetical protein